MNRLSHKATMQTIKTVQVRRKGASGLILCGATLAFIGLATFATRMATTAWTPSNPNLTSHIEGAETYARYASALELLERGDDAQARQTLDAVRREPLVVKSGGVGDGLMQSLSPSTLLIQLTNCVGRKAERAAQAGNTVEAKAWLCRGYRLAEQIANTPRPNMDALVLAHYVDVRMAETEVRMAARMGDGAAGATAQSRVEILVRVWHEDVLPRLPERVITMMGVETRSEEDAARLNNARDRYCLYRMQAGIVAG